MLRLALSLISSLQTGARIKDQVERSIRQAVIVAIAGVALLFAIGFGLAAGYHALIEYGFSALAGASIVAGALAFIGIVLLIFGLRKPKPKQPDFVNAPAEGLAMVDRSMNKVMQQVGPLTLLAVAFAVGVMASRKR